MKYCLFILMSMSYFSVAAQSDTTKTEEETKRPFLEWIGKHVNIAQSLEPTRSLSTPII